MKNVIAAIRKEVLYQFHAWRFNRLRARYLRNNAPRLLQRGFTLIELMIAVLIIGILAAIALPAYASYTVKAANSEGVRFLDSAEAAITEAYFANGVAPGNAAEAGVQQGAGKYVASMSVGTNGTAWVTYSATAPGGLANNTLQVTPYLTGADPSSPIAFVCGNASPQAGWVALTSITANAPPGTTVPANLLSRNCRAGG